MVASTPASRTLLPREHGAYVQLAVALAAGLWLGHGHARAWGQAGLTLALFLASGPALALRGRPDPSLRSRVLGRLALFAAVGAVGALVAWRGVAAPLNRAWIAPALLASALGGLALAGREHTAVGELVAAWALASAAYPVALLGGAQRWEAGVLTLVLAAMQSVGMASVRAFLESLRHQGRPLLRLVPLLLGLGLAATGPLLLGSRGWPVAAALLPNLLVAGWMWLAPPSPKRMRHVGWALALASCVGTVLVLASLGGPAGL